MSTSYTNLGPNSAEGWHARATESTSITPSSFDPKAEDIVAAFLESTMIGECFTLALVKPNLAIDANGRILSLSSADFAAFHEVVNAVKVLPRAGKWDQWRVKHNVTCQPIDKILISGQDERSVYGWVESESGETLELESSYNGYTHLPQELQTLLGLAKEACKGYDYTNGPREKSILQKLSALKQ
jgi:hypothetical protein